MRMSEYPSPTKLIIRPEIVQSTLSLLDGEAASFAAGDAPDLSNAFTRLAGNVRRGEPLSLADEPYGAPMSREITNAIGYTFHMSTSTDGSGGEDWRYLSDLAALAADIEAATAELAPA